MFRVEEHLRLRPTVVEAADRRSLLSATSSSIISRPAATVGPSRNVDRSSPLDSLSTGHHGARAFDTVHAILAILAILEQILHLPQMFAVATFHGDRSLPRRDH
jgi:hypothetical protein